MKIFVPPIKIQGIKTKLVSSIKSNVEINADTLWIEPFMGSGVVGFNVAPKNAIFSDTNPYTIDFYNKIKSKEITSYKVREFLENEGKKLFEGDDKYYYEVRDRFNKNHNALDFLFLNRACFNGMIRFNRKGDFNVPYGHKNNRFSKAYITKIVNQVKYVEDKIQENNWNFICQSFKKTIENNEYLDKIWYDCNKINIEHFYHIGAKENNRNAIIEALLTNYEVNGNNNMNENINEQLKILNFV